MFKITIQVKENKNKNTCNVELIPPKDQTKLSPNEKATGFTVLNEIARTLNEMQNKEK